MPDPPPAGAQGERVKKFKLDPMSLLLPHERQLYQQQQKAQQQQQQQQQQSPHRHMGFDSLLKAHHADEQKGVHPSSATSSNEAGPSRVRGVSSMGEQSGQRQPSPVAAPGSHYKAAHPPPPALPLSPPASLISTPPSWDQHSSTSLSNSHSSAHPFALGISYAPHPSATRTRLEDWEIVETLGTGTFGRVLLVRQRPTYRPTSYHPIFPHLYQSLDPLSPSPASTSQADGQLPHFAMKVLRKSEIVRLKQVEHINSEREILDRVRHPFLVELYATYQDSLNVYMLLSYIPGGELFSHLRRAGRFSADVTRFYLASIILAIEYLHSHNIIYRDLKPENLLLDRTGYLRIADFGFAKVVEDRTFTLCGTPEYLAPEIVLSQGHGKAVDWWALGILAFEMIAGYPPFFDDHPLGIYEKILKNEVFFPGHIDPYAKSLIRGLLTADRSKRLGNLRGGAKDVMSHAWFTGVDWGSLERKEIGAPIVPRVVSMSDSQNFQRYSPPRPSELPGIFGERYDLASDQYGQLFKDFSFPTGGQPAGPGTPSVKSTSEMAED